MENQSVFTFLFDNLGRSCFNLSISTTLRGKTKTRYKLWTAKKSSSEMYSSWFPRQFCITERALVCFLPNADGTRNTRTCMVAGPEACTWLQIGLAISFLPILLGWRTVFESLETNWAVGLLLLLLLWLRRFLTFLCLLLFHGALQFLLQLSLLFHNVLFLLV